jgi:hypothetical protein
MAALSITTVVLSLLGDCPPYSFYVLEVVVNAVMILEVAVRVVAFGRVRLFHTKPSSIDPSKIFYAFKTRYGPQPTNRS